MVGYLDDRIPVGERIEGKEVLGGCEAVTRVLADYRVDQLFIWRCRSRRTTRC